MHGNQRDQATLLFSWTQSTPEVTVTGGVTIAGKKLCASHGGSLHQPHLLSGHVLPAGSAPSFA